jgi:2-oxoglutarate ferredoxin oxidoreductase subunit beta
MTTAQSDKRTTIYQRPDSMLSPIMHYCSGCGHSTVHRVLAELIDELDIRERTIGIMPVGCAVLAWKYIDIDWSEAAHGRPPAVATGLKRVHPDKIVFTYQGDGDLASIGMAETIHAANRGENISVFFVNNGIYGMTSGQMAPTTLVGAQTTTSPRGRQPEGMGHPIHMCELLDALEAPVLLTRTTVTSPAHVRRTKKHMRKALQYQMDGRGFSMVEILSPCPTYWYLTPDEAYDHIDEVITSEFPLGVIRDRGNDE